ncbi:hypothetical protein EC968_007782 [Mortierella alpina]|nr:hypothetical protein EC968_007782 [Mortierella alpina]
MLHNSTTTTTLTLFCLVDGEATSRAFSVEIDSSKAVDGLRDHIKAKIPDTFDRVDAKDLTLWRVSHSVIAANKHNPVLLSTIDSPIELDPTDDISDVFEEKPPKKTIHIIVQRPPPQGDLHADIKKIRDKFFAPESKHAEFLVSYVQGKGLLPITEDGLRGLPKVLRRGAVESEEAQPSLLFLDLPEPPSTTGDPVPKRFKSNVLLGVLERMQAQDLPVFGVSGCGKTRSMIEMLYLQWGFYFNSAKSDLGSFDLSRLADFIDTNIVDSQNINTRFAKNASLLLFLSRLMVFNFCLSVSQCRQTF